MAVVYYNVVKAWSLSTGTGSLSLGDAVPGFQDWTVVPDGTQVRYEIVVALKKEIGLGVYSGGILTRSSVEYSTNDNEKIDVGLNAQVAIVFSAADANAVLTVASTIDTIAAAAAASATTASSAATAAAASAAAAAASAAALPTVLATPVAGDITQWNTTTQLKGSGKAFSTDGTFASNSDNKIPTEKAVKTYADALITAIRNGVGAAFDTLSEIATELALKAYIASPTFTGTPAAPTAAQGTNTTQIATTAYVKTEIPAVARIQGKETIWIPASAMKSRTTNGPSAGSTEMTTNKNMEVTLDFDTSTQEFAQFSVAMPKSWNLGAVTFRAYFSQLTTAAGGVTFGLQGVAKSNGDALDVAYGTAQTSAGTGGTANTQYVTTESSAITIAGSPAVADRIDFQVNRTVADANDTLAQDARLEGIQIFFTTSASSDA